MKGVGCLGVSRLRNRVYGFPLKCQAIGFGLPGRGDVKRVYGLKRNAQKFLDARLPGQ